MRRRAAPDVVLGDFFYLADYLFSLSESEITYFRDNLISRFGYVQVFVQEKEHACSRTRVPYICLNYFSVI